MKNKFISLMKGATAVVLACAMAAAPAVPALASSKSVAQSINVGSSTTSTSVGYAIQDGRSTLSRWIAKDKKTMTGTYVNGKNKTARNSKDQPIAYLDNLQISVVATGADSKSRFKQTDASVTGSLGVYLGNAAKAKTNIYLRVQLLDKSNNVLQTQSLTVPNILRLKERAKERDQKLSDALDQAFGSTINQGCVSSSNSINKSTSANATSRSIGVNVGTGTSVKTGTMEFVPINLAGNMKDNDICFGLGNDASEFHEVVHISYPKYGQKVRITLKVKGQDNGYAASSYVVSRILTGQKAAKDKATYVKTLKNSFSIVK